MKKSISKVILAVVALLGLSLGQHVIADSTPQLQVVDLQAQYNWDLSQGGTDLPVMKFALVNMGQTPLDVTQIGIRNVGTATNTQIISVKFQRRNLNNNLVVLGSAPFTGANKRAVLTGSPVLTIPVGQTRDIEALVTVAPGATLGNTGIFRLQANLFSYTTPTPPDLIGGDFPTDTPTYTITAVSSSVPLVQVNAPVIATPVLPVIPLSVLNKGTRYKMSWKFVNLPKDGFVDKVELWKGGVFHTMIVDYTNTSRLDSVMWTPAASLPTGNNYRIRVYIAKGNPLSPTVLDVDASDTNFRIQ